MGWKERIFVVPDIAKVSAAPTSKTNEVERKLVARVKMIPSHELHSFAEGGLSKVGRALAEWSRDTAAQHHLDEAVDAAREILALVEELRSRNEDLSKSVTTPHR